ncbi:hypothetical protein Tco_1567803, partial [Tanacetum coccineum]
MWTRVDSHGLVVKQRRKSEGVGDNDSVPVPPPLEEHNSI